MHAIAYEDFNGLRRPHANLPAPIPFQGPYYVEVFGEHDDRAFSISLHGVMCEPPQKVVKPLSEAQIRYLDEQRREKQRKHDAVMSALSGGSVLSTQQIARLVDRTKACIQKTMIDLEKAGLVVRNGEGSETRWKAK